MKIRNFLTTVSLILAAINPIKADTGIYTGLALGGVQLVGDHSLSLNRKVGPALFPQNYKMKLGDKNVSGEIYAGYGIAIDSLWLALEGHANLSKLDTKALMDISGVGSKQSLGIKSNHSLGGAVHVGFFVNKQTKAYLKLGTEYRKFHINFQSNNKDGSNLLDHKRSFKSLAFVPGFGIETELSPSWVLRTEYKMALHPEREMKTAGKGGAFTKVKSQPRIHHVSLGIHFKI